MMPVCSCPLDKKQPENAKLRFQAALFHPIRFRLGFTTQALWYASRWQAGFGGRR